MFAFRNKAKGTRTAYCRDCNRAYQKRYYRDNYKSERKRLAAVKSAAVRLARKAVREYLKQNPCVDCGESDLDVLEFDHVRGRKRKHVSKLVSNGCTVSTVMDEIAKCEVRCANCHRRRTRKAWQ